MGFGGWKTRQHYFNDDAVQIIEPKKIMTGASYEVGEPMPPGWDMAFLLTTNTNNTLFDFGDAPDPLYPTLLLSNGAHHIYDPAVYLGNKIDTEPDGLPNPNAQGDDAGAGAIRTFARFRYCTVKGLLPTGCAIDGEGEDYMVELPLTGIKRRPRKSPKITGYYRIIPNLWQTRGCPKSIKGINFCGKNLPDGLHLIAIEIKRYPLPRAGEGTGFLRFLGQLQAPAFIDYLYFWDSLNRAAADIITTSPSKP